MQIYDAICQMTISDMLHKVEQKVTDILITSNSSTTRLLEAITGQVMEIDVVNQILISQNDLSDECNALLENSETYLKRIVSLHSCGKIFSDNIVFASFDSIPEEVKDGLLKGKIPLGKLIGDKETKRELLWTGYLNKSSLQAKFTKREFVLTEYPAKKYLIYVNGRCSFYLLEVFHVDEIARFFWD